MGDQDPNTDSRDDVKEIHIAGCAVRLAFVRKQDNRWSVKGTVECGLHEHRDTESILTGTYDNREEAEQAAIGQVTALLGQNEDRSSSRVTNWN
ncbi:hypothetical protein W02_06350 [Nitrospira sp. KM1]|uniref:hypothetical protein n=1 Tax=Nitrospira sp. KM1 TaxID=1936990 RepID=UPI0013A775C0|nr:hypothetical protein [Nitrospira sp. KM1]BCA53495.1 hypothetical protein W02_06350 [Nitrospira sp. KM1]